MFSWRSIPIVSLSRAPLAVICDTVLFSPDCRLKYDIVVGVELIFSTVVLLSQKVAADGEENHLFGKIHTSAVGRLEWIYRDQAMATRGFRPMWRGSRA